MYKAIQEDIGGLVGELLDSYREHPVICNIDSTTRINRDVIIEVLEMLRWVIFPGYFESRSIQGCSVEYHVGEIIENIQYKLTKQIIKALQYECPQEEKEPCHMTQRGQEMTAKFLKQLPKLRAVLATDVQAAYQGDPAAYNTNEVIFSYPGFFAVTINRIAHELYVLKVPMIPRMMTEYAHNLTGIDIHPGATVGNYFFIDHGTGVVVGETTIIGNNVKIYQGVTLGALSTRGGQSLKNVKRHPTLEDNVTVYSGASILGGETVIGKGAVIGSNAFLTSSVPAETRVSIKNPELQFKDRSKVKMAEIGQEGFFNCREEE